MDFRICTPDNPSGQQPHRSDISPTLRPLDHEARPYIEGMPTPVDKKALDLYIISTGIFGIPAFIEAIIMLGPLMEQTAVVRAYARLLSLKGDTPEKDLDRDFAAWQDRMGRNTFEKLDQAPPENRRGDLTSTA